MLTPEGLGSLQAAPSALAEPVSANPDSAGAAELSVSEVLTRAADLLEKPGAWTQGRLNNSPDLRGPATCFCIIGALTEISAVRTWDAEQALISYLGLSSNGKGLRPAARWNDTPGRTQAEVVAALRQAAALSQPQESGLGNGHESNGFARPSGSAPKEAQS